MENIKIKKIDETHIRVPLKFKEEIQEIIDYRVNKGLPKRKSSRIIQGLMNLNTWKESKERLKKATFPDDKKAQSTIELIPLLVTLFGIILVIGALHYAFGLLNDNLVSSQDGLILTAVQSTFGVIDSASAIGMKLATTALLFGMILAMLFAAWLSSGKIWLLAVDIIIMIFVYIFAVPVRNQYADFLTTLPFASELISYTGFTYFMLNLPRNLMFIGGVMILLSIIGNHLRSKSEELIDLE